MREGQGERDGGNSGRSKREEKGVKEREREIHNCK